MVVCMYHNSSLGVMTKDHLTALVDIAQKLKLSPKYDVDCIKNCPLLKSPRRKNSSNNLLEEVTEYAMRRRPSRDNLQYPGNDSVVLPQRKVSLKVSLANVRECEEDGTCPPDDVSDGMTLKDQLSFVKRTLNEIRQLDQLLSRQFLHVYAELKRAKVRESCMIHQEMLDDVFKDENDAQQTPGVLDAPINKRSSTALRQCGVTRMNIKSKRFSCS